MAKYRENTSAQESDSHMRDILHSLSKSCESAPMLAKRSAVPQFLGQPHLSQAQNMALDAITPAKPLTIPWADVLLLVAVRSILISEKENGVF